MGRVKVCVCVEEFTHIHVGDLINEAIRPAEDLLLLGLYGHGLSFTLKLLV